MPARLTQPLVREDGSLRPATWEEALSRVATGLTSTIDAHGPDAVGFFACSKSTNEANYLAQKLVRQAIGTNNVDSCNRT
jgi:formate dehydrogenase major subunit